MNTCSVKMQAIFVDGCWHVQVRTQHHAGQYFVMVLRHEKAASHCDSICTGQHPCASAGVYLIANELSDDFSMLDLREATSINRPRQEDRLVQLI